jgi:hypothetical protein
LPDVCATDQHLLIGHGTGYCRDCCRKSGTGPRRETGVTRLFIVMAAMLALIVTPVHAQKRPQAEEKKKQEQKPQVDEKAYKAALERIPEPKEKYDPWGAARPAEPAKKK